MSWCSKILQFLSYADLFSSSEMLRLRNNSKYKTKLGGFLSIIIIVSVLIGFSGMIKNTFERTAITYTQQTTQLQTPPLTQFIVGQNYFTIAIFIIASQGNAVPFDLSQGPQIFEVKMHYRQMDVGILKQQQEELELVTCTREHIRQYPHFYNNFDLVFGGRGKCLKLNEIYSIGGVYGGQFFKFFQAKVWMCKNTTKNNNHCASQQVIDEAFKKHQNFKMYLDYLDPILNLNKPQYISHYLNNNNYVSFSTTIGQDSIIYISDYTIKTDTSILPFQSFKEDKGFIVERDAIPHSRAIKDSKINNLGSFMVQLSRNSLLYRRQSLKLSAVFSYIGGLINVLTIALFMIQFYTNASLQMSISLDLFEQNDNSINAQKQLHQKPKKDQNISKEKHQKPNFHFFSYLSMPFYQICKRFGKGQNFPAFQRLSKHKDQINYQLDIKLFLTRIINIEKILLSLTKAGFIKNMKKTTNIDQARQLRLIFDGSQDKQTHNIIGETEDRMVSEQQYDSNLYKKRIKTLQQNDRKSNEKIKGLEIILNYLPEEIEKQSN